ncbi:MAG: hypothetical protein E6J34_11925 [Chloroflexi bacterium]|nr:MAG: hypothetical protein E6J34_11925 [Chloroflexota bacterium]
MIYDQTIRARQQELAQALRDKKIAERRGQEREELLRDALKLLNQLQSGILVSSDWVAARDSLVAETRLVIGSFEPDDQREHGDRTSLS